MNRIFGFMTACVMVLTMAGCGSSGGSKTMKLPSPEPARMVLESNEPFTSTMNVAISRYGPDNVAKLATNDEAYISSVTRQEDGGLQITYMIKGSEVSHDFEASESGNYSISENGTFIVNNYGGTFAGNLTDYLDVNWWLYHEAGELTEVNSYWGLVVYGSPTAPQYVPVEGNATYSGKLRGYSWDPASPRHTEGQTRWRGNDLMLEVDFENMTVSGNVGELLVRGPDDSSYVELDDSNSIAISNGTIQDGGISAEWTGMDTNSGSDPKRSMRGYSGTLSGGFYGTTAEEVGGTMTGSRAATDTTPEQIVFTAFGAKKAE